MRLLAAALSLLPTLLCAQESPSPYNKVLDFPDRFFNAVEKKSQKFQDEISKSTAKYLDKLAKQELKMQRRLAKTSIMATLRG